MGPIGVGSFWSRFFNHLNHWQNGTNGPVLFGPIDPKRTGPNGAKRKAVKII